MKRLLLIVMICLGLALPADAGDDYYNSQLNKGIRDSEVYAYSLIRQSEADKADSRRLLNEAAKYSPDLPAVYFKLAKKDFSFSLSGLLKSIDHLLSGLSAYPNNFWWSYNLVGALYFTLLSSFLLSYLVIIILRLLRDGPLVAHDIKEKPVKVIFIISLIIMSVISPLLFMAGCLVLTGIYLRRIDRAAVYVFLLFVLASPAFFSFGASFIHAMSSGRLKAIVQSNESKGNVYAMTYLKDNNDFNGAFSYALSLKREGRYNEAIEIYKKLIEKKSAPRALVNIGNCYVGLYNFEEGKKAYLDEAVRYYTQALNDKKTVIANYNLSEVSREILDFDKGNEYFKTALALDRTAVAEFRAVSSRTPNRFVVDETIPAGELWAYAKKNTGRSSKPSSTGLRTLAPSIIALLLIPLLYILPGMLRGHAYRCKKCGLIKCSGCEDQIAHGQICSQCYGSIVKLAELDVKDRVARILSVYDRQNRRRNIMKALSFILPGSAYVYSGRILYGLLLLWPFIFLLLFPMISSFFIAGGQMITYGFFNAVSLTSAAIFYITTNILTREGISRGWL